MPVSRTKRGLLGLDSSGLGSLSLETSAHSAKLDIEQRQEEEHALREVERLRLEMQRASERIQAKEESTVVRKKKKKVKVQDSDPTVDVAPAEDEVATPVVKKKKKKKVPVASEDVGALGGAAEVEAVEKPKRKKKRNIDLIGPSDPMSEVEP